LRTHALLVCGIAAVIPLTAFAQKTVTTSGGTANVVPKYSGASTIIDSAIFEDNGNVGIGTTAPTSPLHVVYGPTASSGIFTGGFIQSTINPAANSNATYTGLKTDTTTKSGNIRSFSGPLFGSLFAVDHYGSGSLASAYGLEGEVSNRSTGTVGNAYALWLQLQNTAKGAITNGYGLRIGAPVNNGGGTLTNFYGIYIEQPSALGSSYSIYSAGGRNYFAGAVGIGTSAPSSPLTVNGVIQSTSGGVKFPDGSMQTTAEVQGPAGPQGAQGPAGPTGPTGPVGRQGPPAPGIWGDGSAGSVTISSQSDWDNNVAIQAGDLNFTNFTVASGVTLTIPSGVVIRATGTVTIAGDIVLATLPASYYTPQPGISLSPADNEGDAGAGLSLLQAASVLHPPMYAGGAGGTDSNAPGTGNGGPGGGSIVVRGQSGITVAGNISADGGNGSTSSGGGGGGVIVLASQNDMNVTGSISVNGGSGGSGISSCQGGGGGGGGIIHLLGPNAASAGGSLTANGGAAGPGGIGCYSGGGGGASAGNGGGIAAPGSPGYIIRTPISDPSALF